MEVLPDQVGIARPAGCRCSRSRRSLAPGSTWNGISSEWDPPDPLVVVVPAGHRPCAVAGSPDRMHARCTGRRSTRPRPRTRSSGRGRRRAARPGGTPRRRSALATSSASEGSIVPSCPVQRSAYGAVELAGAPVQDPGDAVGHDRAVPALAHVDDAGLRLAADDDLLAVDRERLPGVAVERGRPRDVEPFLEQVLDVAGDVRDPPRVVRRRAEDDPGRERERDAAGLVPGRPQVELEPRTRVGSRAGAGRSRAAGAPDAVLEPATTQSFDPWPRAAGATGSSRSVAFGPRRRSISARKRLRLPVVREAPGQQRRTPRRTAPDHRGCRGPGRARCIRSGRPPWRRSRRACRRGTGHASRGPARSSGSARASHRRGRTRPSVRAGRPRTIAPRRPRPGARRPPGASGRPGRAVRPRRRGRSRTTDRRGWRLRSSARRRRPGGS